jgi:NAD(P)-dependent dehydrogenase (short-subunit alcohol dehydrogenase family)
MNTYFYDYSNKKCLLVGSTGNIGTRLRNFCLNQNMTLRTLDSSHETGSSDELFVSGDEASVTEAFERVVTSLDDIDSILCSYDFEKLRSGGNGIEDNFDTWDTVMRDWCVNHFLFLRAAVTRLSDGNQRKVVYFVSTRGYTGEGEGDGQLSPEGSIHEAACCGGVTGMMTSIARSAIPKGWAINGIAYDTVTDVSWPKIQWGLNLWLSGIGEYSCGEIFRVYDT